MFTCCPHCKTCFRITKPQLAVAQGKVRCGTCNQVFNGKDHLREDMPKPAAARTKVEPKPATKPTPIAIEIPTPSSTSAQPGREENKTDFDIDLDLFSADDNQLMDDEDDSWLDRLDEDDDEDEIPSPRLSEGEEDELDELFDDEEDEDATEIINISDATDNVFASLGIDVDKIVEEKTATEPVEIPGTPVAEEPLQTEAEDRAAHDLTEQASAADNRYEYYDPNELLDEEKGIDEILQEMDAQLSLEIEQPMLGSDPLKIELPGEGDPLFSDGDAPAAPPEKQQDNENPFDAIANSSAAPKKKDSFESEFLASLDSTLSDAKKPQRKKAKPVTKKTTTKKPPLSYEDDNVTPPTTASSKSDDDIFSFGDTFSGTANDLPGSDEDDIPFQLRDSFQAEEENKIWLKLVWASGILILTLALLIQVAVFRSTDIVDKLPGLQPLVSSLCNTFPCRYTGEKDVSQIKLLSRDIRLHPKVKNTLLITATMVNRAKFKQPYPDLQISLSDLSGEVVAQRRFSPKEYLGKIQTPFLRMPSGKPVKIALEVIDPGQDAVNFEIRFR